MSDGMTSAEWRDRAKAAISGAVVSRGRHKGQLKAKCPPMNSDAAVAWQTLMMEANPYKVSMVQMMLMSKDQLALKHVIETAIAGLDLRGADRDRVALEALNAW